MKKELVEQIEKHTLIMGEVFKNLRVLMKEENFKKLYDMAFAYYQDSKHFKSKGKLLQSFEALMISWAYIDAGLRLDIFELTDDALRNYFTIE